MTVQARGPRRAWGAAAEGARWVTTSRWEGTPGALRWALARLPHGHRRFSCGALTTPRQTSGAAAELRQVRDVGIREAAGSGWGGQGCPGEGGCLMWTLSPLDTCGPHPVQPPLGPQPREGDQLEAGRGHRGAGGTTRCCPEPPPPRRPPGLREALAQSLPKLDPVKRKHSGRRGHGVPSTRGPWLRGEAESWRVARRWRPQPWRQGVPQTPGHSRGPVAEVVQLGQAGMGPGAGREEEGTRRN